MTGEPLHPGQWDWSDPEVLARLRATDKGRRALRHRQEYLTAPRGTPARRRARRAAERLAREALDLPGARLEPDDRRPPEGGAA